jgi:predicted nucleic acid-binding protein
LDLLSQRKFTLIPTLASDVVRAGKIASAQPKTLIRAADSLHLAIAARIGVTHFVSFDSNQILCAKAVLVGVEIV